jgi:hypothetical protein
MSVAPARSNFADTGVAAVAWTDDAAVTATGAAEGAGAAGVTDLQLMAQKSKQVNEGLLM